MVGFVHSIQFIASKGALKKKKKRMFVIYTVHMMGRMWGDSAAAIGDSQGPFTPSAAASFYGGHYRNFHRASGNQMRLGQAGTLNGGKTAPHSIEPFRAY